MRLLCFLMLSVVLGSCGGGGSGDGAAGSGPNVVTAHHGGVLRGVGHAVGAQNGDRGFA
jgi:hypothetical protein